MASKIYRRGADKERKLVKRAKEEGKIAFRSAGSHSPIDVCIIDHANRRIDLIQCKSTFRKHHIDPKLKTKLEAEWGYLSDEYTVTFKAL
jgi:Holliday junction resolvase